MIPPGVFLQAVPGDWWAAMRSAEAATVEPLLPRPAIVALSLVLAGMLATAGPAAAHTESDLVAVPAGAVAELNLRPTHGCGDSPTVEVATRAPVEGAEADEVPGWTASAEPDEQGTVLGWRGGSLPADQVGAFPIRFVVPDRPGELLTFPFVQVCETGEELAWIDGDPEGEYPAPRLLVLPAGSEPAATIADVPPDAPGRDQLVEIVDVDNPEEAAATSTTAPGSTTTAAPAEDTTSTEAPVEDDASAPPADDEDDGSALPVVIGLLVAGLAVAATVVALRRRRADPAA